MPQPKLLVLLATMALFTALTAAAQAEEIVPPSNSAVIQYTETLPTSRGQKDAEGKKGKVKPAKVLGHKNADRLEKQGKQGREVAEFAAETAPAATTVSGGGSAAKPASAGGGNHRGSGKQKADEGGGSASGGGSAGGGSGGSGSSGTGGGVPGQAHGSSALGQIAGQATGTSSGELGLLLPLVILAAVAWAVAFFMRQRRRIA
ncbi:MAG: hypothetical protein ACJ76D_03650 [Solirubrobacterales bacterium]